MSLCRHKGSALKVTNWPDIRVTEEKRVEYDDDDDDDNDDDDMMTT